MPFADPERRREYHRQYFHRWQARNPVRAAEYKSRAAEVYQRNKAAILFRCWANALRANFGVTVEQYRAMLAAQGGVCAICNKTNRSGMRLAVDHCHETALVRGLLCQRCNPRVEKFGRYLARPPVILIEAQDVLWPGGRGHVSPTPRVQRVQATKLRARYGITQAQYDALLLEHGGVCAICAKPQFGGRQLCVDHCHASGRIRGLLCTNCNIWVEKFEVYLERVRLNWIAFKETGEPLVSQN